MSNEVILLEALAMMASILWGITSLVIGPSIYSEEAVEKLTFRGKLVLSLIFLPGTVLAAGFKALDLLKPYVKWFFLKEEALKDGGEASE